ncbi:MAG: drug/metabolite exporter YedA [Xanthomonadales bacterium]|nr:drug/metabolite exporter YedA [Xanthomonadales bacterium]
MSVPSAPAAAAAPRRLADPGALVPLSMAVLYLIWGSTYLAIHYALESYPPFTLAGLRFLVAGIVLYGFLRLRGLPVPTAVQWRNAAFTSVLLLGLGNGLICYAEQDVGSGVSAVAVASMPLFAALFEGLYGNWPSRQESLGLMVGFTGVIVLNLGSGLSGSRLGALALLTAAAAWALGSAWSRRHDMPPGPMNTAAQMLCGGIVLLLFGLLHGEQLPVHPTLRATLAIAYLALFGSIVAFSAYLYVLERARPALATSYAYVNPLVAVLLGVLVAGEQVGPLDLAGMAVIVSGVAVITLGKRRRAH